MAIDLSRIALRRRGAMLAFDEGRLPDAEADLNKLIDSLAGTESGQERRELCECLRDRASVRRYSNRWPEALADLDRAAELSTTLSPLGRRAVLSGVLSTRAKLLACEGTGVQDLTQARRDLADLRNLGLDDWLLDELDCDVARQQKDWERVAELSPRIAARLAQDGWPMGECFARLRTGNALLEMGELNRAEVEVRAAHSFFSRLGPPDRLAAAELALARILAGRGQLDEAWPHAERALTEGESLIRHFRSLVDQQHFAADKLESYNHAFAIAFGTGGEAGLWRAWAVAERAKSFYLCQLVANAEVGLLEGLSTELAGRMRELDDAVDLLDAQLSRASQDPANREKMASERAELAMEYNRILAEAMRVNPRWAALRSPPPLDLEATLALLPAQWSVLAHYWQKTPGGAVLHVFATGPDRRPLHWVNDWSAEDLQEADSQRERLEREGDYNVNLRAFPARLADKVLPPPLVELLQPENPLLISSHGVLSNVALHALPIGPKERLIERCPVMMIPTLALLTLRRQKRRSERSVLLLGCAQDGFNHAPLADVKDEIDSLERMWTERAVPVSAALVPREGSPESCGYAPETWSRFDLLHLACHGEFDAANPLSAALLLGSDRIPASKFFTVRLNASLVALSACDVGRRTERLDDVEGSFDEWLGLYLPLFYAGAQMLLTSRWKANSQRAAKFMNAFHEALAAGQSPPAAMRTACVRLMRGPEPFWANWTLVGMPDSV